MTRILFGGNSLTASSNTHFLNSTVDYFISTKRFDDSILITGNNEKAQFSNSISFLFFYFWNDLVYFSLHVLVQTNSLIFLSFLGKYIKVNESRYIALFLVSGSIKKLVSIDYLNTYIFSIFCSINFARWESVGLPHSAYIMFQ